MSAIITNVYSFTNGQTMTFDQYGQQMPEFNGPTKDVLPRLAAAGFTGPFFANVQWQPREQRYTTLVNRRGK